MLMKHKKVQVHQVARHDASSQTEPLPETQSVGIQVEELPVITQDF